MIELESIDPQWAWRPFEPSQDRPWDRRLAAHLFRRAGFGADTETLEQAVVASPAEVVERLVTSHLEPSEFRSDADALSQTILASGNPQQLSAAWVYRLLFTPTPLIENMTLFWHGHFATSAEKVKDVHMMWTQNELLREHALGRFADLAQAIAKDPAMLIYLDSAANRKSHPNENFARELMELFCLGEGNYSETDVQELSRCFTGWEIKNGKFRKNRYQHDEGTKTVLGQTGNWDGEDGVRIVSELDTLELFLARKWFRYFIADEPEPSYALLRPLAQMFRQNDLQIVPAIRMILSSNLFFSDFAVARKIKSPTTYVIGMLRSLKATTDTRLVAEGLRKVGQGLFYPPNVKGWDGGRSWINSSTLLGRSNLVAAVLENTATKFDRGSLSAYLRSLRIYNIDQAIKHFEVCLLPVALQQSTRDRLRTKVEETSADLEQKLRATLHALMTLPECQLG